MKVKDILGKMDKKPVSITQSSSVLDAISLMNMNKIGSLIVLDGNGALAGIVTERDILYECALRVDRIHQTQVGEIMTKNLIIGVPDDTLEYLLGIMTKNRIRHLPIVDNGAIIGMVSILDLVEHQLARAEYKNRYMEEYIRS